MKRNTSFNPQMKQCIIVVSPGPTLDMIAINKEAQKKRKKKTLSLDLTLALRQP